MGFTQDSAKLCKILKLNKFLATNIAYSINYGREVVAKLE
jgi:hypothetical protein